MQLTLMMKRRVLGKSTGPWYRKKFGKVRQKITRLQTKDCVRKNTICSYVFTIAELGLDCLDYFIILSWDLCFMCFKKESEILAFVSTGVVVLQGVLMLIFHLLIHDYSRVNCVNSGPKEKGVFVTGIPEIDVVNFSTRSGTALSGVYTCNLLNDLEFYLGQILSLYEAKSLGKYV